MIKICAWCDKELEGDSQAEQTGSEVSHGICRSCLAGFFNGGNLTLADYLNQLDAPILLLNEDGDILFANHKVLHVLGKELQDVKGFRGGPALECAYSGLPGGCGGTIHCRECTIRSTVTETYRSGTPSIHTPAYYDRRGPDGIKRVALTISTVKAGSTVILRINEIG